MLAKRPAGRERVDGQPAVGVEDAGGAPAPPLAIDAGQALRREGVTIAGAQRGRIRKQKQPDEPPLGAAHGQGFSSFFRRATSTKPASRCASAAQARRPAAVMRK